MIISFILTHLRYVGICDNIEAFGGDPQKVTAVGQSVGAGGISLHLASYEGNRGVPFQQAIGANNSETQLQLSKKISQSIAKFVTSSVPEGDLGVEIWPAAFANATKEELNREFPSKLSLQLLGGPHHNIPVNIREMRPPQQKLSGLSDGRNYLKDVNSLTAKT
ncbi:hypothetical protein F4779DRAFT_622185 [Xylariaceae sp. FL0662B]|nr:hypothetical protein F4779DRAFT_622185 [Xylariaceae sp. FL0662B]